MIELNLSNEWQYIGNTEAVTLYRRTSDGSGFDGGTAVPNAFSPTELAELTGGRPMAKGTNNFILWSVQTGSPAPKVGDVIQDAASVRWSVVKAETQAFGARYSCDVVQER